MEFGHHPDPAVDFCLEVEAIENDLTDRAAGLQPQITDIGARIDRAMQFKVGGDTGAVVAKTSLRTIEQAFKAGAACGVPVVPAIKIQFGPEAFRFDSFQQWVNKAQSWFQTRIPEPARSRRRYVAVDAAGSVCLIGADFMRARDRGTFPVVVYLIDAAAEGQR